LTVWFVTPAFGRFELSEVCLRQRRSVIDTMKEQGVDAECVVIADDQNLEIARSLGFATVVRDNRWLGRKFNDGFEYAMREGADWLVPIGSDDWIDPAYLLPLPSALARTSHFYAPVESTRLALVSIPTPEGAGPRMYHRSLLGRNWRPSDERIRRGVDRSVLRSLGMLRWEYRDVHSLQYVGFRGPTHITLYAKILDARGGEEHDDPWSMLARHFPPRMVEEARVAMSRVRPPRSVGRLDAWGIRDRLLYLWGRVWPGDS
jgi:glycosyltransferase involved in cell wall biosynthesis